MDLKSRLCVQGYRQVPGVDYDQTWCGAMRDTSLRVLSQLAANSGMNTRRYDFVAAYLQGELLEADSGDPDPTLLRKYQSIFFAFVVYVCKSRWRV